MKESIHLTNQLQSQFTNEDVLKRFVSNQTLMEKGLGDLTLERIGNVQGTNEEANNQNLESEELLIDSDKFSTIAFYGDNSSESEDENDALTLRPPKIPGQETQNHRSNRENQNCYNCQEPATVYLPEIALT